MKLKLSYSNCTVHIKHTSITVKYCSSSLCKY